MLLSLFFFLKGRKKSACHQKKSWSWILCNLISKVRFAFKAHSIVPQNANFWHNPSKYPLHPKNENKRTKKHRCGILPLISHPPQIKQKQKQNKKIIIKLLYQTWMTHLTVPNDRIVLCTDQHVPRSVMLKGVKYQDFTLHINRQSKWSIFPTGPENLRLKKYHRGAHRAQRNPKVTGKGSNLSSCKTLDLRPYDRLYKAVQNE